MTSYLESLQSSTCVWFEVGDKRNVLVSMLAGTLFFVGWWIVIDAQAKYPGEMLNVYHMCGVLGTLSLFMINSVTNAQIRGDGYNGGFLGTKGTKGWLFVGFVLGFAAVIAACGILFTNFVAAEAQHHWPGVGIFLQNIFIFVGSLTFKFGRNLLVLLGFGMEQLKPRGDTNDYTYCIGGPEWITIK